MQPNTAQKYIGSTCRINYEKPVISWKQVQDKETGAMIWVKYIAKIPHMRTGVVTNVSVRKLTLLAFNGETEDFEYYITLKNIKTVYEIKP